MPDHQNSDRDVQQDVLKELAWDTRVAPTMSA